MFKHHHKDRDKSSSSSTNNSSDGFGYYPNPGINNLGNSCFLNSVIQGLAASRPLRDALAAYPGAERALKASHGGHSAGEGSTPAQATSGPAAGSSGDETVDTGEIDRISAAADLQRQGLEKGLGSPSALVPGTPTTETSPSLQLLTEDPFPDSLPLSSALASTLVKLWNGKQSTINVKNLMRELNRKNEDWNEWDQMDAHELLRFLLDGVSMEELDLIKKLHPQPDSKSKQQKKKKKRKGPRPIAEQLRRKAAIAAGEALSSSESDTSSSDDGDLPTSEAESLLEEDPSYRLPARDPPPTRYTPFIDTIFGGKLASVIVCEECRGVSRIEEDFLDISLPIKGDDGKVRRRDRLRKFLGSSSNLSKEAERPRLAPRAPTNILNPSESEASETDEAGTVPARDMQISSNASISSGGAATSSSGHVLIDRHMMSSKEETEDEREAHLRSRRSSEHIPVRSPTSRRGFLTSTPKEGGANERSLLSRGTSLRIGGSADSSKTIASEKSRESDTSTARKKSKQAHLLAKPTKEQQEYIRQLFAEIPLLSNNSSPLAHLRIAQPGGQHTHHIVPTPTAAETNGSPLAMADATETGLYQCLVQFTSVELLDGENAFQCRRCWKLLHPELVAQVGRKRAAQALQKKEAVENKQFAGLKNHFQDDTPRASVSAGSDVSEGRNPPGVGTIAMNRKLLAERERQLAAGSGSLASSSVTSPVGSPEAASALGHPISQTPNITVTAYSPPISPGGTSVGLNNGALESQLSALSVTPTRSSLGSSPPAPCPQDSFGLPASSMSDLGAEADEEDRSDLSDLEQSNGDLSTGALHGSLDNSAGSSVYPAAPLDKDLRETAVATRPDPSRMPVPTLPPRSQRFVPRRAHKRYLISALPPILVLHLKRFQQTSKSMFSSFGDLKKLDDRVTFPLYLDMAPFMAPPPLAPAGPSAVEKALASGSDIGESDASGSRKNSRGQSKSWFRRSAPSAEMRSNCVYRLYAVIMHKGNMGAGHYVAMTYTSQRKHEGTQVKAPAGGQPDAVTKSDHEAARQWIYCSDHMVRPASVDEVFKSQAYLLMYERVDPSEKLPAKM